MSDNVVGLQRAFTIIDVQVRGGCVCEGTLTIGPFASLLLAIAWVKELHKEVNFYWSEEAQQERFTASMKGMPEAIEIGGQMVPRMDAPQKRSVLAQTAATLYQPIDTPSEGQLGGHLNPKDLSPLEAAQKLPVLVAKSVLDQVEEQFVQ